MAPGVNVYSRRRSAVFASAPSGLDGLLITAPADVRYLTGFTGTNGWLLLWAEQSVFLTDPRYTEQAAGQLDDVSVVVASTGLHGALGQAVEGRDLERLGFDPDDVTVSLKEKLDATVQADWVAVASSAQGERRRKDAGEIEAIRAAVALTEAALEEVVDALAAGMTELEVAARLEGACRRRGADAMAFETIVASGPRSALPHGVASGRRIEANEPLMIDMGCKLDGYCSDLTRMIWCGGAPDRRWLEVHEVVDRARAAALAAVGPGVGAVDVDAAARAVVAQAGHAEAFSHGTGHGVGLEIHEAPKVSSRSADELEVGMVLTIEPGVYLEGEFGIRIEDLVYVTEGGCERLTTLGTEPILRGTA